MKKIVKRGGSQKSENHAKKNPTNTPIQTSQNQHFMKYSFFALCLLLLCGAGCGKDGDTNPNTNKTNYLTMKVNGQEWKADAKIAGSLGVLRDGEFVIGGELIGQNDDMTIVFENVTGPGTYRTDDAYSIAQFWQNADGADIKLYQSQQDGKFTLNITRADRTSAEGTFSGTLDIVIGGTQGSVIITDGKFKYDQ